MVANVLILGCGRSGTSILGELFDALPQYEYLEEPFVDDVPSAPQRPLAVKVPRLRSGTDAPPGCALPDRLLATILPEPVVVVWQVRHPLDAVCSLRVGIADDWGHHPRPPDWEAWTDRPLVERCAHHWATINTGGFAQVAAHARVNRFEDMVGDPLTTAHGLVDAVGIDVEEVRQPVVQWAARVRDTDDEHFVEARGSRRRSRPDHARRVGRWEENLTPAERARVVPIVGPAAATFGYTLNG